MGLQTLNLVCEVDLKTADVHEPLDVSEEKYSFADIKKCSTT